MVRRLDQKPETKYLLSNAPLRTAKMTMVNAGLSRWTEEQCFEQGKDDLGLSQYQTKTWPGWHRHATLVMLAHSFLTNMIAQGEKTEGPASVPQLRSVLAPALEDWNKLDRRFNIAEYHRERNEMARESHRRRARKKVS